MTTKKHILLTGAGFTKNFGAPLARELWNTIAGHPYIKDHDRVRSALLADFDFESVYHRIMTGDFSADEKTALARSVKSAYLDLDAIIEPHPGFLNMYGVRDLIRSFSGQKGAPGFVFTLNQDLFLERHYLEIEKPTLPGIPHGDGWFNGHFGRPGSLPNNRMLPEVAPPASELLRHGNLFFVKLHGSTNWYSSKGNGQLMVIGGGKEQQIDSEPLLARYMEIFRSVLQGGEHKLLVIGYSFADPHINDVLLQATKTGLELFILGPGSPETVKERMDKNGCPELWNALGEYFQHDLRTLFPEDQRTTPEWKRIQRRFFDRHMV